MNKQHDVPFIYYNDFAKIIAGNKIYHFGNIQAKVIKQLYVAASTDSPWIFGKQALYNAGSSTIRMSGLFGSKLKSQEIIQSDRRGYYRLNPNLKLYSNNKRI